MAEKTYLRIRINPGKPGRVLKALGHGIGGAFSGAKKAYNTPGAAKARASARGYIGNAYVNLYGFTGSTSGEGKAKKVKHHKHKHKKSGKHTGRIIQIKL
jgi:hypothetical protein